MLQVHELRDANGQATFDEPTQTSIMTSAIHAAAELMKSLSAAETAPLVQAIQGLIDNQQLSANLRRGIEMDARSTLSQ